MRDAEAYCSLASEQLTNVNLWQQYVTIEKLCLSLPTGLTQWHHCNQVDEGQLCDLCES